MLFCGFLYFIIRAKHIFLESNVNVPVFVSLSPLNSYFFTISMFSLIIFVLLSSPAMLFIIGNFSKSAAIQLRETTAGADDRADTLLIAHPEISSPLSHDSPHTPLPTPHKQPMEQEVQLGQPKPKPNKQAMEDLQSLDAIKIQRGISSVASQSSGGRDYSDYRPSRRGSPRRSTHDHFDINEHLPWMIVLLLLLVLVVIVVCSVKRSSRVLKKGPLQDPNDIIERAIQKKPPVPLTQVREKWIYYSNGQGKSFIKT